MRYKNEWSRCDAQTHSSDRYEMSIWSGEREPRMQISYLICIEEECRSLILDANLSE